MWVKFGMEEDTFGTLRCAKFHPYRCNSSPLRGKEPQNRRLNNLNDQRFVVTRVLQQKVMRAVAVKYNSLFH